MTVLETERLLLKPVTASHEEALHRLHGDGLIVRALWGGRRPTRQHISERLAAYLEDWRQLGIGFWMVYEKCDDGPSLVGRSGLRPLEGSRVIEFGHCFSTAGSGRGLAVEAGRRVFEHAFSVLSIPLLVGLIAPDNTAAIRVADKLGQRFVGFRMHRGRLRRYYETTREEFLRFAPSASAHSAGKAPGPASRWQP
jgi:RimJ/RimL family protein N-acetyltransferase